MFFVNSFYVFWIHLGTRNWFGHHIRSQFEHLSQDIFFHCTAVQQWYDVLLNRLSLKRLNLTYFFIDFVDQSYDSVKEKQLDVISFSFLTWVSFARFDIMKKIISILARTSSFLSECCKTVQQKIRRCSRFWFSCRSTIRTIGHHDKDNLHHSHEHRKWRHVSRCQFIYLLTDYGRLMKPVFIEIPNFCAWTDNLGR